MYEVIGRPTDLKFGVRGVERVLQNVRIILTTPKYSVSLDREFGIDFDMLDMPINIAKARLRAEIVQAIRKYEPRAVVREIDFMENETDLMQGRLIPRVIISEVHI